MLAELSPRLGKHRAQELLQDALRAGRERGETLEEALRGSGALDGAAPAAATAGCSAAIVDAAVRRGRAALATEADPWG